MCLSFTAKARKRNLLEHRWECELWEIPVWTLSQEKIPAQFSHFQSHIFIMNTYVGWIINTFIHVQTLSIAQRWDWTTAPYMTCFRNATLGLASQPDHGAQPQSLVPGDTQLPEPRNQLVAPSNQRLQPEAPSNQEPLWGTVTKCINGTALPRNTASNSPDQRWLGSPAGGPSLPTEQVLRLNKEPI